MTAIISPIGLVVLLGGASGLTALRWRKLLALMLSAQRRDQRFDRIPERIRGFFVYVLGQGRLLRWPYAGVMHVLIFWGFLVLLTAIAQGIVEALWQGFNFADLPFAGALAFLQDLFASLVLVGIVMALVNRLVVRPIRFRGSHEGDALLILAWIAAIMVMMQSNYATRIAQGADGSAGWRPFASAHTAKRSMWCTASPSGRTSLSSSPSSSTSATASTCTSSPPRPTSSSATSSPRDAWSRSTWRRRTSTTSAAASWSTSPGRTCSTSTPAPSAGAARPTVPPSTPASRSRPRRWSPTCATSPTRRRRAASPPTGTRRTRSRAACGSPPGPAPARSTPATSRPTPRRSRPRASTLWTATATTATPSCPTCPGTSSPPGCHRRRWTRRSRPRAAASAP